MKRLRVALVGTGKAGDAFRVRLPTYQIVDVDYGAMTAIVDVPDECYPPAPVGKPETVTSDVKNGQVITAVDITHKIAAVAYFDKRYAEHAGAFALEVE